MSEHLVCMNGLFVLVVIVNEGQFFNCNTNGLIMSVRPACIKCSTQCVLVPHSLPHPHLTVLEWQCSSIPSCIISSKILPNHWFLLVQDLSVIIQFNVHHTSLKIVQCHILCLLFSSFGYSSSLFMKTVIINHPFTTVWIFLFINLSFPLIAQNL